MNNEIQEKSLDLKYRPRNFDDILGNVAVVKTIKNLIETGTFNNFSVFSGPPGCGKTTMAFIVAKALQCETYNGRGICGHCPKCKAIEETLYEDGKGNPALGVNTFDMGLNTDEEYINTIALSIQSGSMVGKKVMIIEELQRTKKDSQESLLRTLEFIPDDVYVIVTTSDPNKIIQALRTRATEFKFNYPTKVELKARVKDICVEEDIKVSAENIDLILDYANNNPRQTLKLLEIVKNSGLDGIEYIKDMKAFNYEEYINFLEAIKTSLMDTIIYIENLDSKLKFYNNLKYYFKDYLVLTYAPSVLGLKKDLRDKIKKSLSDFKYDVVMEILEYLSDTGYIREEEAGVRLLVVANKLNKSIFKGSTLPDRLTPDEINTEVENVIEELDIKIKNTAGNINISDL